ncbi:SDR family oxidoreductase [Streptomyces sp. NPDC087294]|uniref:SDR family oxidoreductase n=1 Tax=Streptomyces sp. NPDC087294 TaxID=3365777 RepID=UPI00380BCB9E
MNASTLDDNLRRQAERALHTGDFTTSGRLHEQLLPDISPAPGTEDAETLAARVQYALALYGLADYPAGLTRSLARELGPHGICVNTVLPGAIQVDAENTLPEHHRAPPEDQIARQCVPRRGQPDDIAAAVGFLAGPSASFISSQSLHIDGGWILH